MPARSGRFARPGQALSSLKTMTHFRDTVLHKGMLVLILTLHLGAGLRELVALQRAKHRRLKA